MTFLRTHEQNLINRLRDPTCPQFCTVIAPPGLGIRVALEMALGEVATESIGLVLVARQIEATQWADNLRAAGVSPVALLTDADTALQILEKPSRLSSGAIVTTYTAARTRLSRRVLSELQFGLVIQYRPIPSEADFLNQINSQARRVVTIIDHYTEEWSTHSPIFRLKESHSAPIASAHVSHIYYEETPPERELRASAVEVLVKFASRSESSLALTSDSLPALRSRLLISTMRLPEADDLVEEAWGILDRMDDLTSPNSQLEALGMILQRMLGTGERCVVVAPTDADANYIATLLATSSILPRAVITESTPSAKRKAALASLGLGECIVATAAAMAPAGEWRKNTTLILCPPPTDARLQKNLVEMNPGATFIGLTKVSDQNNFFDNGDKNLLEREPFRLMTEIATATLSPDQMPSHRRPSPNEQAQTVSVMTPTDKGRRIVGSERTFIVRDLVRRYKSGESIRSIATSTGRSYGFVHRALTESGVQLRQRGGARRRKKG